MNKLKCCNASEHPADVGLTRVVRPTGGTFPAFITKGIAMYLRYGLYSLFLVALVIGCRQATGPSKAKAYPIRGKVVSLDKNASEVTLDHEDIPGLMKAMEMSFKVKDPNLLVGVAAGDAVSGSLEQREDGYLITELRKE